MDLRSIVEKKIKVVQRVKNDGACLYEKKKNPFLSRP